MDYSPLFNFYEDDIKMQKDFINNASNTEKSLLEEKKERRNLPNTQVKIVASPECQSKLFRALLKKWRSSKV